MDDNNLPREERGPGEFTTRPIERHPHTEPKRPLGVTALAVLAGLAAVMALVGAFGAFFGGAAVEGALGGFATAIGAFLLVYALIAGAVAYGLFKGATWAWYAALVLAVLGLINGAFSLFAGDLLGALVALALNGLIIWYLLKDEVKAWFGLAERPARRYRERTA